MKHHMFVKNKTVQASTSLLTNGVVDSTGAADDETGAAAVVATSSDEDEFDSLESCLSNFLVNLLYKFNLFPESFNEAMY